MEAVIQNLVIVIRLVIQTSAILVTQQPIHRLVIVTLPVIQIVRIARLVIVVIQKLAGLKMPVPGVMVPVIQIRVRPVMEVAILKDALYAISLVIVMPAVNAMEVVILLQVVIVTRPVM